MSYEEEMRNLLSGVPDEFEPLQQTLDVWMDLPEPELPPEEPAPEPEQEPDTSPMSQSEAAAYEYSMMMRQYEAMLEDWNRREAEEQEERRAREQAEAEADGDKAE